MPKLGLYSALGEPKSNFANADRLSPGAEPMPLDEPFPLNQLPSRVRNAILREFNGRCPSQQEVAEISDARWLSTPDVGTGALQKIRASGQDDDPSTDAITDAELLGRLAALQAELRLIQRSVRMQLSRGSTKSSAAL
jgi:hypothetical protein